MEVIRPDDDKQQFEKKLQEGFKQMQEANRQYVQAMKDNPIFFMAEPMMTPLIAKQETVVRGVLTGVCPMDMDYDTFKELRKEYMTKIKQIYENHKL